MWFFRAVAFDLDGTLASADRIAPPVLAAIDVARRDRAMLLVTGRTRRDLERVFPGLLDHFDAVVTENGAVLTTPGPPRKSRVLHEPVDEAIEDALADRGITTDRGEVLLALDARDAPAAAEVIAEVGLDAQLVHNRGAAMILPAGVTKGTGLEAALRSLGLGPHNTVAVGDAENDLTLVRTAEVGVAVANALPSLTEHADLVLDQPNGAGTVDLLGRGFLSGRDPLWPARRRIPIGTDPDGATVTIPGAQASMLLSGATGSGKSYLAGLLAERWGDAGYSVLLVDPEGDHTGLSERPNVVTVDATTRLPSPRELLVLFRPLGTSVVLDLSGTTEQDRQAYLQELLPAIAAERLRRGMPHWVIYDEAHEHTVLSQAPLAAGAGNCLVTWRPEQLVDQVLRDFDVVIDLDHPGDDSDLLANGAEPHDRRPKPVQRIPTRATLLMRGASTVFTVGPRSTGHVRHQHKYAAAPLPPALRFYFRDDGRGGAKASANLEQFHEGLGRVDASVIAHHAARGDFSRWIGDALADQVLAREVAHVERDLEAKRSAAAEEARGQIRRAIAQRYLT